ncbi:hypothetical protein KAW18_16990 [candidate division WOR-3 bacterium]|nr:hypothetical protein [candidate division WOR-3 bacterium]MCK4529063.1 hypothetical protein [candidate division WOR-3 bacterium]
MPIIKKTDPAMLIASGSFPTYGWKHLKHIAGLTRMNILINIIIISRGKMEKGRQEELKF